MNCKFNDVQSGIATDQRELSEAKCRLAEVEGEVEVEVKVEIEVEVEVKVEVEIEVEVEVKVKVKTCRLNCIGGTINLVLF